MSERGGVARRAPGAVGTAWSRTMGGTQGFLWTGEVQLVCWHWCALAYAAAAIRALSLWAVLLGDDDDAFEVLTLACRQDRAR